MTFFTRFKIQGSRPWTSDHVRATVLENLRLLDAFFSSITNMCAAVTSIMCTNPTVVFRYSGFSWILWLNRGEPTVVGRTAVGQTRWLNTTLGMHSGLRGSVKTSGRCSWVYLFVFDLFVSRWHGAHELRWLWRGNFVFICLLRGVLKNDFAKFR